MLRAIASSSSRFWRATACVTARDPIVPRAWAEEVAAALPRGRLVEVAGAPHAVNYAAPDELARLTLAFLAQGEGALRA